MWKLAKPLLFRLDPEHAHKITLKLLKFAPRLAGRAKVNDTHSLILAGLNFINPIGLAAGLDKNAECLLAWQRMGFGFIEIGTVTKLAQKGNPSPRLFRLPAHQALYNRMGFNNDGAKVIAHRIEQQRLRAQINVPIGVNIGKSAVVDLDDAAADYSASFQLLADVADYIVINVSSPNTKHLRDLQKAKHLARILEAVSALNHKRSSQRPIFVKIAPDLDDRQAILTSQMAMESGASGIIVSNTTVQQMGVARLPSGGGGLSGAPLFQASTRLLGLLRQELGNEPVLFGSGGVMTADDAVAKMRNGADLVQIYSGLIFNGPKLVEHCVRATIASSRR